MQPDLFAPLLCAADVARSGARGHDAHGFDNDAFPDEPPCQLAVLRSGPAEIMLRRRLEDRLLSRRCRDVHSRMAHGLDELHDRLSTQGLVTTPHVALMGVFVRVLMLMEPPGHQGKVLL